MAKRTKVRQYAFQARNTQTKEHGTFLFEAKNLELAEAHRWHLHSDPGSPIECAGYVGPIHGSEWVYPEDVRGFVDGDTARAEWLAEQEEVDHDPAILAQFVEERGRQPERGAELGFNLLNPNGKVIEISAGTPHNCDPRFETYHSS